MLLFPHVITFRGVIHVSWKGRTLADASRWHAAILLAVSDPSQAGEDRYSLSEQDATCRQAAERLRAEIVEVVRIPGHSRHYDYLSELEQDCPEYAQLTNLIRREAVNLVIVYRLDRLWRERGIGIDMERLCKRHGVKIYSCMEPVDPDRGDNYIWNMLASNSQVMAAHEIEHFVQMSRDGKHGRAKSGLHLSWVNPPYGYRIPAGADKKTPLEIEPLEARWVRHMVARRLEGWGYHRIHDELIELGVPTKRAAYWSPPTVQRILNNPFYAGVIRYTHYAKDGKGKRRAVGHEDFPGLHEPIITQEEWQALLRLKKARTRDYTYKRKHPHLLTGMIRCGYCGDAMTYWRSKHPDMRRAYVHCGRYVRTSGRECKHNNHSVRKLHAYIKRFVKDILSDPDAFIQAQRDRMTDTNQLAQRQEELAAIIGELVARINRLNRAYEAGALELEEFVPRKKALQAERAEALEQQGKLENQEQALANMRTTLYSMAEGLDALDEMPEHKLRAVYKHLIYRIILRQGEEPEIIVLS